MRIMTMEEIMFNEGEQYQMCGREIELKERTINVLLDNGLLSLVEPWIIDSFAFGIHKAELLESLDATNTSSFFRVETEKMGRILLSLTQEQIDEIKK